MKHITIIFALLFITVAHVQAEPLDRVLALVNDDVVLQSDLNRRVHEVKRQLRSKNVAIPDEQSFRQQILERLISDNLQWQLANRAGIRVSDDQINQTIHDIASEQKLSVEQLREQLTRDGISYEGFREDIAREIMAGQYRQRQIGRRIFISDQETAQLAQALKDGQQHQDDVHLSHILLSLPENANSELTKKAQQKATKILEQLQKNGDFAQIATRESQSQEALEGGDLGWRNVNQLPALFAEAIKNKPAGTLVGPLRSGAGLHILKIIERRGSLLPIAESEQVHAEHILLRVNAVTNDAAAEQKLQTWRKDILAGKADLKVLAKQHSEDVVSASRSGDLGWNDPTAFTPAFTTALAKLSAGEISPPIKTPYGWHLIRLIERRRGTQHNLEQQARQMIFARKFDEELETWLREVREQAYVKILAAS